MDQVNPTYINKEHTSD